MFNKYVEIIRNYVEMIANVLFWLDDCVSQKNSFTIMRTYNYNYANIQLQLCEHNYSCVLLTQRSHHTRFLNCLQPPATRDRHVLDTDHCQSQRGMLCSHSLSPDGLSPLPSHPHAQKSTHIGVRVQNSHMTFGMAKREGGQNLTCLRKLKKWWWFSKHLHLCSLDVEYSLKTRMLSPTGKQSSLI